MLDALRVIAQSKHSSPTAKDAPGHKELDTSVQEALLHLPSLAHTFQRSSIRGVEWMAHVVPLLESHIATLDSHYLADNKRRHRKKRGRKRTSTHHGGSNSTMGHTSDLVDFYRKGGDVLLRQTVVLLIDIASSSGVGHAIPAITGSSSDAVPAERGSV